MVMVSVVSTPVMVPDVCVSPLINIYSELYTGICPYRCIPVYFVIYSELKYT
jgi:hypothetical protein